MVFALRPSAHLRCLAMIGDLGTISGSSGIHRFIQGGVVKTFRWADEMFVAATAKTELDFDAIVGELRRVFPDSAVISDDYYATRLERSLEIAREQGMSPDCAPLQCLRRVASEHGLQRHLSVAVTPHLTFDTRIDKLGLLAVTQDSDDMADAEPLLTVLRLYSLEIETS